MSGKAIAACLVGCLWILAAGCRATPQEGESVDVTAGGFWRHAELSTELPTERPLTARKSLV